MGCQCCRMMKSVEPEPGDGNDTHHSIREQNYIYDPSEMVDVIKTDSAAGSLYRPHHLPGSHQLGGPGNQKQGFNNLGYSRSNGSTLKLEVDNNHVNHRLHAAPALAKEPNTQGSAPPADGGLYIIQPVGLGPRWGIQDRGPSQVPVYPELQEYVNHRDDGERGSSTARHEWAIGTEGLSADEIDEGVGGTPEGSVLSVEIHTSTTSVSSADTRDERRLAKNPDVSAGESGISVMKGEDEEEQRVTDSMVAEAIAAMEAATAGEDSE